MREIEGIREVEVMVMVKCGGLLTIDEEEEDDDVRKQ